MSRVIVIGIDKQGRWFLSDVSRLLEAGRTGAAFPTDGAEEVVLVPKGRGSRLVRAADLRPVGPLDVVFPVLHGTLSTPTPHRMQFTRRIL